MIKARCRGPGCSVFNWLLVLALCFLASGGHKAQEPADLHELRQQGNIFLQRGEYARAIDIYQKGFAEATQRREPSSALRFLSNRGSVEYQLYRFRTAIRAYLQARDLATQTRDREALSVVLFNLSSLYNEMGESDAAFQAAQQGLAISPRAMPWYKAKFLLQQARADCSKGDGQQAIDDCSKGDWQQAIRLIQEAIRVCNANGDTGTPSEKTDCELAEAEAWNELGDVQRVHPEAGPAEQALSEALSIGKSINDPHLYDIYISLAKLRISRGDSASAIASIDQAIQAGRPLGPAALWDAYYQRGKAERKSEPYKAFRDLETSLQLLRSWRAEIVPADIFRVASEVKIDKVYSEFLDLANQLYWQTGEIPYAEAGFQAADENRRVSLKVLWTESDLYKSVPAEYRAKLSELSHLEAGLLDNPSLPDTARQRMLVRLAELDSEAALDRPLPAAAPDVKPPSSPDVRRPSGEVQKLLGPEDLYLYFYVGDSQSALWVLTSHQFQLYKLPSRSHLEDIIGRFEQSIKEDKPDAAALGQQLYSTLFGAVDAKTLGTPHWMLSTDGPLSLVPFAALVTSSAKVSGHPRYLVEDHSIEFVPNNSALLHSKPTITNRRFVGVGDPIYNRADPRLQVQAGPGAGLARIFHTAQVSGLELARLGGSGREIEKSAAIWRARGYQTSILEGRDATRQNVMSALPPGAAVVHIAAHLVAPESFAFSAIALSLQPEGPLEILSTTDIAATPAATDLVILDACGSGSGPIRPGAGVMGMARAWLAAGAHTVVATHWEITDADSGAFIETFYDHLSNSGDPIRMRSVAEALRDAQLAALSARDWRSKPFYWATYFCTGRN